MSYFSPEGEDWLRSRGVLQSGERIAQTSWPRRIPGRRRHSVRCRKSRPRVYRHARSPRGFINAIEESTTKRVSANTQQAIRALNLAQISGSTHATAVLSISSIEALAAEDLKWTANPIDWPGEHVGLGSMASSDVVSRRARWLMMWWKDWEDVYGRRSGLFHGGASDDRNTDVFELAADAMKVCGRIVLSTAKQEGAGLPAAAQLHFGVS